ncbi:hypothetical protein V8G54_030710 [Vigna mungo]|uniref:Uncharacterized protein n=1 Tax=Vigna mungo TaxID=3915 RepID=A0AAQ3MVM0_VIGMU
MQYQLHCQQLLHLYLPSPTPHYPIPWARSLRSYLPLPHSPSYLLQILHPESPHHLPLQTTHPPQNPQLIYHHPLHHSAQHHFPACKHHLCTNQTPKPPPLHPSHYNPHPLQPTLPRMNHPSEPHPYNPQTLLGFHPPLSPHGSLRILMFHTNPSLVPPWRLYLTKIKT